MIGCSWNPPQYMIPSRLPFIPLEVEIDNLIAGCNGRKVSTFLQILKETAMRSGEADKLKWTNVDFEARLVRITPEKGSKPRILKLSNKALTMLNGLQRESNWVFGGSLYNIRRTFERQRKRLAVKLGNPRLDQITFHTLRHWKATMLYNQTEDIYYVQRFLGHKSILNTMIYISLEEAHYHEGNEKFICKVTTTIKEAEPLIEAGFEYVCEIDGTRIFKKRK
ncbi:MAG: integrase/recombinase XerD [Thermoproteota archaeon]|nr:integrase/recombinase XerD [Thermoproteota archaeon]